MCLEYIKHSHNSTIVKDTQGQRDPTTGADMAPEMTCEVMLNTTGGQGDASQDHDTPCHTHKSGCYTTGQKKEATGWRHMEELDEHG